MSRTVDQLKELLVLEAMVCKHGRLPSAKNSSTDTRTYPRQIDGPHIMKRHAGKKLVNPQWQPFKFLR